MDVRAMNINDIKQKCLGEVSSEETSQRFQHMSHKDQENAMFETIPSFEQCRYCVRFLSSWGVQREAIWNTPIMESEHFVVVPTLGMLVPGWLLIVTKGHYLNMALLPNAYYQELDEVKTATRRELTEKFGLPVLFEHGPACPGESAGCGIDHAHWHAVPLPFDLLPDLEARFRRRHLQSATELRRVFYEGSSYLFYENQLGDAYLFTMDSLPSQFFRRLVAEKIGKPQYWDWHTDPGLPNILTTLERLQLSDKRVAVSLL